MEILNSVTNKKWILIESEFCTEKLGHPQWVSKITHWRSITLLCLSSVPPSCHPQASTELYENWTNPKPSLLPVSALHVALHAQNLWNGTGPLYHLSLEPLWGPFVQCTGVVSHEGSLSISVVGMRAFPKFHLYLIFTAYIRAFLQILFLRVLIKASLLSAAETQKYLLSFSPKVEKRWTSLVLFWQPA